MHTDSYFVIGKDHVSKHTPCQDHARSIERDDVRLIVVSDGCSTGRFTDIGARIITCATTVAFNLLVDTTDSDALCNETIPQSMLKSIKVLADANKNMMGLITKDMFATCVYAVVTPNAGFIHVIGDGCVILKYIDGSIVSYVYEWQDNRPYYLMYEGEDFKSFTANHKKNDNGIESLMIKKISIDTDGTATTDITYVSIDKVSVGHVIPLTKEMIADELECITICSDGVTDFKQDKIFEPVEELIKKVVAFKTATGDLVKRRLTRIIVDYAKQNVFPLDDVAVATVYIKQPLKTNDHDTDTR